MRSQIFGACIASANSPVGLIESGLTDFLKLGINASQLVIGVPWYGYDYKCVNKDSTTQTICDIPYVPFRGVRQFQ